ncbi:MAG TPA: alpha/beta hydrolase [Candidatus Aquicultor sp.]|jgi:pimeloyl-ACP methyl ester carboxylesterase
MAAAQIPLRGLNVQTAIIGGISLGAWAALKYATYNPGRIDRAVLICPSSVVPPRLYFAARAITYTLLGEWGSNRMKRLVFRGATVAKNRLTVEVKRLIKVALCGL